MRSKTFIFSGPFGGGKTETAVSILLPDGTQPVRLVIDPEIRADTYQAPGDVDIPAKHLFAFDFLSEAAITPQNIYDLMKMSKERKWVKKPGAVILDNTAMIQEMMIEWWKVKQNMINTATLYGKQADRVLTNKAFNIDAGFINLCKTLFKAFMLDLKEQGIFVVITSPPHNVWKDYNKRGYDANGNPLMRVLGQTANVLDAWVQMADVIWTLTRQEKVGDTMKMLAIPKVSMDLFNPKAALPGVPEQFTWPGWETIWKWYADRTHTADVTKLPSAEASWSGEQEEEAIKLGRLKFIKDLNGILTLDQIKAVFAMENTPIYTRENHNDLLAFFKQYAKEHPQVPGPVAPETPEAPDASKVEVPVRTLDMFVSAAAQYGLKDQVEAIKFLKGKGFKSFSPKDYDLYVGELQKLPKVEAIPA
jgi:hypothetical protein